MHPLNMYCCCHDPDYSRLCRLINNDSLLLSYTESQPISLTKESEKNLLILLSQVSREIRSWENIQDCTTQQEIVGDSASGGKCSHGLNSCSEDNHNCLDNIVTVLVTLFTVESQYVQHSTGNTLLLISNFLAKSGKKWVGFLHLLCLCLEAVLSNVISSQSLSLKAGNVDLNSDTLSFILAVRKGLAHANWRTTSCLIQVLRNILKQDYDSDLMERYIHSVSNCLSNIPWDMLSDIHAAQTSETRTSSITNILHHGKFGSTESRFLFLGALLQLFCSLTEQTISIETGGDSLDKHPPLDIIIGLVPKILSWSFQKQGDYSHAFASQYLRHKMLVLMTRLTFQSRRECSTLVLWLQLLRRYFQDLINQPFSGHPAGLDDSLEESPFQADVVYGDKICTPHLQRQAIFLFLKCSFSLINLGKEADAQCSCATTNSHFTYELQYDQECCNKKRGLSELSEWLQRHVPLETFVDSEVYLGKCRTFASSFLQLYMDEDDFLFEVLLQLTVPFPAKQVEHKEKEKTFEEAQGDVLFHLSNIFNPVHLFHLFLAELHYDHLVLLDYLISKDTGIHCVQYLLRCLRTVSSSWCMFVEYSLHEVESSQLAYKKRKFPEDGPDSNGKIEPSPAVVKEDVNIGLHDRESIKNPKAGGLLNNTKHKTFENAKECLFSLKRSVENLHQKNLFPYTPSALLRSFTRFMELCHQQEKV